MKIIILIILITASIYGSAYSADIIQIGGGGRLIALGRAYAGMSKDTNGMFINPAGIAKISSAEVGTMYANLSGDVTYTMVNYVWPTTIGTFGIGYLGSGTGDLIKTTIEASGRMAGINTFNYGSGAMVLSYGDEMRKDLSWGYNLKYYNKGSAQIEQGQGTGVSLDVGFIYERSERLNIGLSCLNLISTGIRWNSGVVEAMPYTIRGGIMFRMTRGISILIDSEAEKGKSLLVKGGLEWWIRNNLALRAGIEQTAISGTDKHINYSCGVGLGIGNFKADYAYYYDTRLLYNSTHFVSLGFIMSKWERKKSEEEKRTIEIRMVDEAGKEYEKGKLPEAAGKFKEVLKAYPNNTAAKQFLKEIEEKMATGITAISTGESEKTAENVKEKLVKALNYFYAREYDLVVKECGEVLMIDKNNLTALKRMGSAFYMKGDKVKALEVWIKASEIEPANIMMKKFIEYLKK